MTTTPPNAALESLKLGNNEEEINPWASKSTKDETDTIALNVPLEISNAPPPVAEPVFTPAPTPPVVDTSVLSEFDPLVDKERQDAQDAWAASEAHPPPQHQSDASADGPADPNVTSKPSSAQSPPRTPTKAAEKALPPDPESPTKAPLVVPSSASAFTTTFANLARSFSRPRSAGSDVPVSPARPGPSRLSGEISNNTDGPLSSTAVRTDSKGKPAESQFDFQKFLDQLKTRSAEPVAQYFRRLVSIPQVVCSPLILPLASSITSQGEHSTLQIRSSWFSSSLPYDTTSISSSPS